MAGTEKNELLKEIAFLSNLIHSHKQQANCGTSIPANSSYSPKKWTPSAASWVNQQRRIVAPPTSTDQRQILQTLNTKPRATRKVVTSSQQQYESDINGPSKVNNAVRTMYSSSGNRTVAVPHLVTRSRCVLARSQVERTNVCHSVIPVASRSVLKPTPPVSSVSPVPPLRVTVTSHTSSGVRAVTTVAPSMSRTGGLRTVVMGLQNKTAAVSVANSGSIVSVDKHRVVCSPPPKPVGRVVLKPTAYKWAAKAKSPPVKMGVVKPSFPVLVAPHKFTKLNCAAVTSSSPYKKANFSPVLLKTTKLNPLVTSTPVMKSSLLGHTPLRDKLLKKTIKSKYSLVRSPAVRTERKLVKNLYTWFNGRAGPTSTPRLKRKVGKYSLQYVKSNRTLKKFSLQSSSYYYNSMSKVLKNRSVRHGRCRFGTSSSSVSLVRNNVTQKYKFFKRECAPNSPKASLKKNLSTKLVMIGGILYKSSKNKLARTIRNSPVVKVSRLDAKKVKIVTVRGVKFRMDSSGKTLQRLHQSSNSVSRFALNYPGAVSRLNASFSRVDLGGVTFVEKRPGVLVKSHTAQKRTYASQVVNRSIHRLVAANKKSSQYCMFFNRFGKCHKKESQNCPYKHDPDMVAVCTRFLLGSCTVEKCLFSHKVCRTKMPACSFFLEGRCSSDDCPYLHVNVNPKAEVCKDFLKGYCSLGEKCKKRHTYVCPEFQSTGKCEKGKKCFLRHTAKPKWKKPTVAVALMIPTSSHVSEESVSKKRKVEEVDEDDKNLPFKHRRLPSFIKLADDSDDET